MRVELQIYGIIWLERREKTYINAMALHISLHNQTNREKTFYFKIKIPVFRKSVSTATA